MLSALPAWLSRLSAGRTTSCRSTSCRTPPHPPPPWDLPRGERPFTGPPWPSCCCASSLFRLAPSLVGLPSFQSDVKRPRAIDDQAIRQHPPSPHSSQDLSFLPSPTSHPFRSSRMVQVQVGRPPVPRRHWPPFSLRVCRVCHQRHSLSGHNTLVPCSGFGSCDSNIPVGRGVAQKGAQEDGCLVGRRPVREVSRRMAESRTAQTRGREAVLCCTNWQSQPCPEATRGVEWGWGGEGRTRRKGPNGLLR